MTESIVTAWQSFDLIIALGVLVAYAIVDAMYAYYTVQVVKSNALKAATSGALMHFLLALGVLSYVGNFLYVLPIAIGSWFGTYYTVSVSSRKAL